MSKPSATSPQVQESTKVEWQPGHQRANFLIHKLIQTYEKKIAEIKTHQDLFNQSETLDDKFEILGNVKRSLVDSERDENFIKIDALMQQYLRDIYTSN